MAKGMGKRVYAVLNRVREGGMEGRLRAEVERRGLKVAGTLHEDPEVFEAGLLGRLGGGRVWEEAGHLLDFLLEGGGCA